jgi:ubiquinone/menaquinone biosynthesis C-methylase UbiE
MSDDRYRRIYRTDPERYDRLVSREDQRGRIFEALMEIAPYAGFICADIGAGTGRMTRQLALLAQHVYSFDIEASMLQVAEQSLSESGLTNWQLAQADSASLPLFDNTVDLAVEGWSFGHTMTWHPDTWQQRIRQMIGEMQRITRPGGTIILLETMGTNTRQPEAPAESLKTLYQWWEDEFGFDYRWIRTDYQFESMQEADELLRFFFGDEMADAVQDSGREIVPECTGIWWKTV